MRGVWYERRDKEMDIQAESLPDPTMKVPLLQARARRLTVLKAAEGLWKDRTDIRKNGVEVQEQLRAEWNS